MVDADDPLVRLKITSATCSAVAIATTVYRLFVRRGRFWVDDAWALFSMVMLLIQIVAVFLHVPNPADLSSLSRVAAYYLLAITFYAVIWSARVSILFSIIRLDPSESRRRRLFYISLLFILVCIILITQLFWVCEPEPGWKNLASPQCKLGKQVAICQLITDIIADSILIAAPLKLLAGLEDKVLRRRLIIIFSTCIITTIVSLVHAAYIIRNGGTKILIAALVEDCLSLIVCNVPVVITATFRLRQNDEHDQGIDGPLFSTFLSFATFATFPRNPKTTQAVSGLSLNTGGASLWDHSQITSGTSETADVREIIVGKEQVPEPDHVAMYTYAV